jgi:hypothetical protein
MCSNMSSVASISMAKALAKYKIITCLHKYYEEDQLIELFISKVKRFRLNH